MSSWRILKDRTAGGVMFLLTIASILVVVAMAVGLIIKSMPLLESRPLGELLFSSEWKPLRGEFGFLPFLAGTLWVTGIAIVLALPVSLLTAIYLVEYAQRRVKRYVFPMLDILAGLPSVIYGVWGVLLIVPVTGYTLLTGGIVLGVMILPLLVSLLVEIFSAVPDSLREASASLGATQWQSIKRVVLRKTSPGILAAVVLAISRALGETIAVLMVCGNLPEVPHSMMEAGYPLPALIANNYGEMLSLPLYEAALMFAALVLFVVILLFNVTSRVILYRVEKKFAL
ncbi:MAG: phosphate ABC transporter permease subunit PstC [Rikenellaceae bacterium]|jgi:phosphate transport system permease protein|nr:phosphate ABC transporter permease subunit PstC [Rikenellaceae bacterium]